MFHVLRDLAAWLCLNAVRSETTQFRLLMEQTAGNVWRKCAYQNLLRLAGQPVCAGGPQGETLNVFRERVDFAIENVIPAAASFEDSVRELIDNPLHQQYVQGIENVNVLANVLTMVQANAAATGSAGLEKRKSMRAAQAAAAAAAALGGGQGEGGGEGGGEGDGGSEGEGGTGDEGGGEDEVGDAGQGRAPGTPPLAWVKGRTSTRLR